MEGSADDFLGQQLGNYRLLRFLGHGGSANVYLGEHIHLRTYAAIKVLHMRVAHNAQENFLAEARMIAGLNHPHIVRILDFGIDTGVPFLVMSYAPHGSLRQKYPKGTRLPSDNVASYLDQVAQALQYAHNKQLIHRDVKPENMLLEANDDVKLSDFGIALLAQTASHQSIKEVIGTAAYMAPEQLQGKPCVASDQYALGIIVYEWLAGERPFQGTFMELFSQHLAVAPSPLREKNPSISPAVEQIVLRSLEKDPQRRFNTIGAFALSFRQACEAVGQYEALSRQSTIAAMSPHVIITPTHTPHLSAPLPPLIFKQEPAWGNKAIAANSPSIPAISQGVISPPLSADVPAPLRRSSHKLVVALSSSVIALLLIGALSLGYAWIRGSADATASSSGTQSSSNAHPHTSHTQPTSPPKPAVNVPSLTSTQEAGHVLETTTITPLLDYAGHPIAPRCNGQSNSQGAVLPQGDAAVVVDDRASYQMNGHTYVHVAYRDPCNPTVDFSTNDAIADGTGAVGWVALDTLTETNTAQPNPQSNALDWRDCFAPTRCKDHPYPTRNDTLASKDSVLFCWWDGSHKLWDVHWWHVRDHNGNEASVYGRDWVALHQ